MTTLTQPKIQNKDFTLQFTGNWYIDLGILGMVFLMDKKFGYSLEKTKRLAEQNSEAFKKMFTCAFLHEIVLTQGKHKASKSLKGFIDFRFSIFDFRYDFRFSLN